MRLEPAGTSLPIRRRRARRARYFLAAVIGLAVLAAGGCANSSGGGAAQSQTITIAVVPGIANAPLYLAQKDGLFAAAGLTHVVIKSYPTQTKAMNALLNGQADIVSSDYGTIFYQEAQRANSLRILADAYDAASGVVEMLTPPGSSVKPGDLANQRIGVPADDALPGTPANAPVSLESAAAARVLFNFMGANSASVQWVPLSQTQEINDLFHHKGNLAAILVTEPYIYQAEQQYGAQQLIDAASGFTANIPLSGYAAMNAWVRQNPGAVKDFQSAITTAQAQASMQGPIQQILPKAVTMTPQAAQMVTLGTYPTSTSVSALQRVERLLSGVNLLGSADVNVPAMVAQP